MGFWIFMLISVLLFPVIMIIFGKIFIKNAPKEINPIFGYRTTMSMKNKDTWEFAHTFIGKLWFIGGWILLPMVSIPMLFVIGEDTDTIGNLGSIICAIGIAVLVATIFPTEAALKKNFDKNGNHK